MGKNNGVEEISEHEFHEVINKPVALVDFFAEWCMPCVMMAPVIEELASKLKQVKFAKVNVDENSALSQKFKIMSIPCLIVFKDGKEVERIIGSQQAEVVEEKLKKWIK